MTSRKNETDLNKYKRDGKKLLPPFAQIEISPSSWIDDRLPDMLWVVLIISKLKREDALNFFRYCIKYVENNNELSDITLSGISKFPLENKVAFIKVITSYDKANIKKILRPILLYKKLPAFQDWKDAIKYEPVPKEDWVDISNGLRKCYWHQSEEATDCRWVKVLALIISGKMNFPSKISEILNYPNEGDLRFVRPCIRSAEIATAMIKKEYGWAKYFWDESYKNTLCIPEMIAKKENEKKAIEFRNELETSRKHYIEDTKRVRHAVIDHFFEKISTSGIDAKYESVFGLVLYGLGIFIENIFYKVGLSINGRVMFRTLLETYITLAYLLKQEKVDIRVWEDYRSYGSGQANLIYRKFEESNLFSSLIDREKIEMIANEDKWVEFVPINLGHWDNSDLRKMCEVIGEKELYDKYYAYTSGFVHANWSAIRESVFQKCLSPLHRLHRVPIYDLPLMPSVTEDMLEITNKILDLLSKCYPPFESRLTKSK